MIWSTYSLSLIVNAHSCSKCWTVSCWARQRWHVLGIWKPLFIKFSVVRILLWCASHAKICTLKGAWFFHSFLFEVVICDESIKNLYALAVEKSHNSLYLQSGLSCTPGVMVYSCSMVISWASSWRTWIDEFRAMVICQQPSTCWLATKASGSVILANRYGNSYFKIPCVQLSCQNWMLSPCPT
jgi:hypothetical protein